MTTRTHARLAPSAAHRWMNCPGSVKLSESIEETPSYYAAEGSAAHELAERCLRNGWDVEPVGKNQTWGEQAIPIDREMVDGVQLYLDTVRNIIAESDDYDIECRLEITPEIYGTADLVAYREKPTRRITVVDFKYGKGVAVDVQNNPQLLTYAVGLAKRYHNRGVDEVALVIVQPRAPHIDGPVRHWVTDIDELQIHERRIESAIEATVEKDPELNPGPWCKFCKAAAICPALSNEVSDAIGTEDPRMYDAETLAVKLRQLPMVQNWCKRLEEFAHAEAVRGRVAPGFKLVNKRATRQWKDVNAAATTLELMGVDEADVWETKIRSPAQIEKVLPRGERKVVNDLSEAKPSGTVLAPIEDPRQAVDPQNASGFIAVDVED